MFNGLPLLESLGFHAFFQSHFLDVAGPGDVPARVSAEHRGQLVTLSAEGERRCTIAGRLRHQGELPHVGDWVAMAPIDDERGVITHVLPRSTVLWRRRAGSDEKTQVLLANVDTVCVVSALDGGVNPRRIERFLALILEGGIRPVIVLAKADLCENLDENLATARQVAGTIPVLAVSVVTGQGLAALDEELFRVPQSVALLGASGVGKSTLINRWLGGGVMATSETLDDGRGRHTTTHRQLLVRPEGGVLLDTPGVREVGVLDADEGILGAFSDVDALAAACRFPDCSHVHEPGCAVREAVEQGFLDGERLEAFHKLQRENAHARTRDDPHAQRMAKSFGKSMERALRSRLKEKRR